MSRRIIVANLLRASCFIVAFSGAVSAVVSAAESDLRFARDILPILSNKCFACHGPDTQDEDQLRLDSYERATLDRGGYRAIDPQDLTKSVLLERIHDPDAPMPPADAEKQLTEPERKLLDAWVARGGEYEQHWAFVPPVRPAVPAIATNSDNPIDAFVGERLQQAGHDFAPPADRPTLARRAALLLTGLPPEPGQLRRFLDDTTPGAYERFVDELLASPRYGEHQARYWLDAVRYGDTHGLHLDNRRGIYPYRDWVIKAINENLPIDRFIVWQLAGDLLDHPTLEQRVATGFVRMNPTTSEGGALPEEFQAKNNFDRVETLGTVLLGMTLTCARCHTHKYDPIPQQEYYQLMAFFNSTAESSMDGNAYEYGPIIKAPQDLPAWEQWQGLTRERDAMLQEATKTLAEQGRLPETWLTMTPADQLNQIADAATGMATPEQQQQAQQLLDQLNTAQQSFTTTLVAQDLPAPRPTHVLRRGEYDLPTGDPLEPDILSVMGSLPDDAPRNRLGLARWLTSREHPLVARVLVNQFWLRVFGDGLVRTPEDFGVQGQFPTHPELLDWLAVEFQEQGWDLKRLMRMMVTSRTFCQSSARRPELNDPENRLLARGPSFRLDAEVIRDLGLWASGLLDLHMGGEGVKPYQPAGMWLAMAHPASNTKQYVKDNGQRLYRRSLYVYWKRTSPHPMMTLFDAPSRESSCVKRSRSSTPLQSLGLFNETQRIEMSRKFAERLLRGSDRDEDRVEQIFMLIACRPPLEKERAACLALLASLRSRYTASPEDAAALLKIGDAPSDETFEPAELAAWSQLTTTLLASDLALLVY
jgi:hypothetical protein